MRGFLGNLGQAASQLAQQAQQSAHNVASTVQQRTSQSAMPMPLVSMELPIQGLMQISFACPGTCSHPGTQYASTCKFQQRHVRTCRTPVTYSCRTRTSASPCQHCQQQQQAQQQQQQQPAVHNPGPSLASRLAAMSEQQLRQHIVADRARLKQMSDQLKARCKHQKLVIHGCMRQLGADCFKHNSRCSLDVLLASPPDQFGEANGAPPLPTLCPTPCG